MRNRFIEGGQMIPVGNDTVVEKVIQQLTTAISKGRFKLGEKLPSEFELMDELHVSRNSLREAMKMLATMGIVDIRRGDGTYICSQVKPNFIDSVIYSMMLESSSDEEIVELRQTLDEAVLKMAISKRTPQDIAKLQSYITQMRNYFKNGEISQAARLDYEFHLYLTECCKNPFLARIVKGVYQLFERSIEKNIRTEELFAKADEHHQNILNCLIDRDYGRVNEVVINSLSSWKENVKKRK
jgi:GntR family transcriptional repressor for pyruvate dehydrogenase complex